MTLDDATAPENPLIRVVRAAQAYRSAPFGPVERARLLELCAALDALAVSGAEAEIERLGVTRDR